MKFSFANVVLILSISSSSLCRAQVTGTVFVDGAAPPVEQLQTEAAMSRFPPLIVRVDDPTWTVGPNRELANVLVYLKSNGPVRLKGRPPVNAVDITARGYMFVPRVVGVMVGQDVKFANRDATPTQFHSHSVDNAHFSFGLGKNQEQIVTLRFAEIVPFDADFFEWQRGWICCFEHPFFAVTGLDGKFSINPAPPNGEYSIIAWHETGETQKKVLTVKDGRASIDLAIKPLIVHAHGAVGANGGAAKKPAATAPASPRIAGGKK